MSKLYAQGDLLIEHVGDLAPSGTVIDSLPTGVTVLAEGEATGHRHLVVPIVLGYAFAVSRMDNNRHVDA